MKTEIISRRLDRLHTRMPKIARSLFIATAVVLCIAVVHITAAGFVDAYTARVLQQFARANSERSILALPLGHLVGLMGVMLMCVWLLISFLRAYLCVRAATWRRAR